MAEQFIPVAPSFWNIRGDFRIGGVLNVGTHCSLVRLDSGRFVFLDSYTLTSAIRERVMAHTDGGRLVDAVLNVHPFHTVHCARMARDFPTARFYGSARHAREVPEVDWAPDLVESAEVAAQFPDFAFSMPDGIDYICQDESVHAGSLLVFHPNSAALHVDDTLNVLPLPPLLRRVLPVPRVAFHPKLRIALEDSPDAGERYLRWADDLARDWSGVCTLCAAHSALTRFEPGGFSKALRAAVRRARPKLGGERR